MHPKKQIIQQKQLIVDTSNLSITKCHGQLLYPADFQGYHPSPPAELHHPQHAKALGCHQSVVHHTSLTHQGSLDASVSADCVDFDTWSSYSPVELSSSASFHPLCFPLDTYS